MLDDIYNTVKEQAEDWDLWFLDANPREAALQRALRHLHMIIELEFENQAKAN